MSRSAIDEALETGHNRFDKGDPVDKEREESEESRNVRNLPALPTKEPVAISKDVAELDTEQDIKDDYEYSRKVNIALLDQQQEIINGMTNLINAAPSARAYEVLNNMIKNAAEMARDLLAVQKNLREAQGKPVGENPSGGGGDTYNFIGGPTQIVKELKKAMEAEKKVIDITPED